jgi:hypothetical protein
MAHAHVYKTIILWIFSAGRTASRGKAPLGSLKTCLFIKIHKFGQLAFNGRQWKYNLSQ